MQTIEKALKINLDARFYGTIAEIGAGQEVARNFFQAGAAAGSIAKTMSAYDMQVSDAIYGQEADKRYVTQSRVKSMLNREYGLVIERLENVREKDTCFFAFADTVAAKSYNSNKDCHGWMGLKYQINPGDEPSEIILHVRMKDPSNLAQQRALGILGVNLIYGAFYDYNNPEKIIEDLLDNVGWERLEIDMIKFSGGVFKGIDNRLMALHLVRIDHTRSVMFNTEGETVHAADLLYKKNIVLLRGTFRPITNVHLDILRSGEKEILKALPDVKGNNILLLEISMSKLVYQGTLNKEDFLGRVETLNALGFNVQISNFTRHFQLKRYLSAFTNEQVIIMLGARKLRQLFDEKYYTDLDGGIGEGLGVLLAGNTKLFVYPKVSHNGEIMEVDTMHVDDNVKYLFRHFLYGGKVVALKEIDENLARLETKTDGNWKESVPHQVFEIIKKRRLFGYQ